MIPDYILSGFADDVGLEESAVLGIDWRVKHYFALELPPDLSSFEVAGNAVSIVHP
jgi:hypothetical protein